MRAVQDGFDMDVIRSILDGKPPIDVVDQTGKNAYSFANERDDAKAVKDLLDSAQRRR